MSKTYQVKEMFVSLQGEGARVGRRAVFCRLSKCNLWNGRESARANSICRFCDTDIVGTDGVNGGAYSQQMLIDLIVRLWHDGLVSKTDAKPYVIFTGGEPALQLDEALVKEMHQQGFEVAIETNGTLPLPDGIDWVCVSPKGNSEIKVRSANELKLVFPQEDLSPNDFEDYDADHFYLSPMADYAEPKGAEQISLDATKQALAFCMANPKWRLSLQTQKYLQIK